jgi:rhodanese-related sulfurtransferase
MLRVLFYAVIIFLIFTALRRAFSSGQRRTGGKVIDMPPPAERPKVDTTAFASKPDQMDYEITPDQFKKLREQKSDYKLVDVREPWEFQTAKIDGATLMPVGDVPSRAHQELDPEQHIVVYCHHGVRSMNVTSWLRQQGFEKAQSLAGGIDRWAREIDPTVPKY